MSEQTDTFLQPSELASEQTMIIEVTLLLFKEAPHPGWKDPARPRPITEGSRLDLPSELWVAQCLEYDLTGQGLTREEALESFRRVLLTTIGLDVGQGRVPLSQLLPAPARYQQRYRQAVASHSAHKPARQRLGSTRAEVPALPTWMIETTARDILQVA